MENVITTIEEAKKVVDKLGTRDLIVEWTGCKFAEIGADLSCYAYSFNLPDEEVVSFANFLVNRDSMTYPQAVKIIKEHGTKELVANWTNDGNAKIEVGSVCEIFANGRWISMTEIINFAKFLIA